ncbi:Alpha/Beta hydrolase protein [Massariosphaeria phaeospora]|uniref:Alpha/Beta hydrolase protein n=1 Tax=Massariosphaeria phaeospora TaxID=100035 RepID=A0A7C8MBY1_9PLEO|nr:Alpha/Beta hydrolase protein [Massariosphaeria phaeospora]
MIRNTFLLLTLGAMSTMAQDPEDEPQTWPTPDRGSFVISNFTFDAGETLDRLDIHYRTLGEPKFNADGSNNVVLIGHGSTASSEQFLNDGFAGALFNPGQVLDAQKYFIIMPDGIGHGNSSKPSNTGLRARFPSYQYSDMVRVNHRLVTEHLKLNHTRLVMGVSMGAMHTWVMGSEYPDFTDALFPIACQPAQIAGHNRLWRKLAIELLRTDPAWHGGNYTKQPLASLSGVLSLLQTMFSSAVDLQARYPTRDAMDAFVDALLPHVPEYDANDQLYAWNASHTYDPEPQLGAIRVPLTAVNTADDLMNPPQLGLLERAVGQLMRPGLGKAVVIPESEHTVGHGSYIMAKLWVQELELLLARTEARNGTSY